MGPRILERVLNALEGFVVAVLATAALIVGATQVILRYAFDTGFPWSEGVLITLTVWAMLLAGSRAVRDGVHIRVDFFVRMLPQPARRPIFILAHLISFGLCVFFAYCGYLYSHFVWQIDAVSTDSGIPDWVTFSIIPLAMGAFTIRYIQILWRMIVRGEDDVTGHSEMSEAGS